jgi:uncharacterized protein (TIGR03032 family)
MPKIPTPFACSFSPNLPELLSQLNCTLVITTYQAGKVIFISAKDNDSLIQLPRSFNHAMGIAVEGNRLAVATKDEVVVLVNSSELARNYPKSPGIYDALFMPRVTYYTGQVDMHDLHWGNEGLWGVNTSFSCLALINDQYSWVPKWQPSFIKGLASEDRCHLNGLAMLNGVPKYVTALGHQNGKQQWRSTLPDGGVLIDVEKDQILLENLSMPHSPILYNGELYLLLSARGELIKVTKNGYKVIKSLNGFVRGMALIDDYLFIGLSKLRQNASTFKDLEIASKATQAGIKVIHLPTQALVGELIYQSSVEEIYDLKILPKVNRPGILNSVCK